ncbi:Aste57867_11152 [Aphanomyces stellatus]|uniref:Aste57867_11152 protein n=1 Tax=Aphanomyces stellatus TaxID=120398 RepID=A0A485KSL1_9STRA|nr:hypothetical protein As57867_011110 [Aphanomyces stellatus]VFT88019.1 Aste57867_11152 [Aphanomyces stellatus]
MGRQEEVSITVDVSKDEKSAVGGAKNPEKASPQFDFVGTVSKIVTGIPLTALLFVAIFGIAPAFYVVYVVVLTLFCLLGPLLQVRNWLGVDHEAESYSMLLRLEFGKNHFFRKYVKTLDKLPKVKHDKEYDGPLKRLVKAQIKTVKALITGGSQFIETKDTMSLGSVVVSTVFFLAYFAQFAALGFKIERVNSKIHDALAIILPLLLSEELAVGMSEVLLWARWTKVSKMISDRFKIQYRHEGSDDDDEYSDSSDESDDDDAYEDEEEEASDEEEDEEAAAEARKAEKAREFEGKTPAEIKAIMDAKREERQRAKEEFNAKVGNQCLTAGVGATDMTGAASFLASLWTLLFLFQGYVVDGWADFSPAKQELMATLYWFCVIYSFAVVLFCYLPFFNASSDKQKKEYDSVAASCASYLYLDHLGQMQDHIVATLTKGQAEVRLGETRAAMVRLRKHAVQQIDDSDLVSYALFILALSTYNFFEGEVDDDEEAERVLDPIDEATSFHWSTEMGEEWDGEPVDEYFPSFLLKPKSLDEDDDEDNEKKTHEDDSLLPPPPPEMTLFSVPVMGFTTLKECLIERGLTDFKAIHTNAIVQDKNIYMHNDLMAVGLEIKVMTGYTVCIYIMAARRAEFGDGPIYATVSDKLKPVIFLRPRQTQKRKMKFVKVSEKDQLRAFATCSLALDPNDAEQTFELDVSVAHQVSEAAHRDDE